VYVQTAQENSDSYVITEGLNEGDQIIYEGNFNLAHDAPVVVKN
jgi:multidrug efflux pump subunit AcrA (membrane-fusion protein)